MMFNAGSCDSLHLYSETHTDMLYNPECKIQVHRNPSICMNMYSQWFLFSCCLISAEWMNSEVDHPRAEASLQNILLQMLHLSKKAGSNPNILLTNQSDSVSVPHQCCLRGINNLFGSGEGSMK